MNGVLNINKPAGITSHDVVARVRKLLVGLPAEALAKVGHAGTLDPFATGVLIVAVGSATRLLEYTKDWSKTYEATITLGATSDTDDVTGTITPFRHKMPDSPFERGSKFTPPYEGGVVKALEHFIGTINQIPPAYAAIKVKGKKLYEYARAGESITPKPRQITIHSIDLIDYDYPNLAIRVKCSSGTYIRALARDIGKTLETGAYVSQLVRTVIHTFHISDSLELATLAKTDLRNNILDQTQLVEHLPAITLSPANVAKLRLGQSIALDQSKPRDLAKRDFTGSEPIAIFDSLHNLVGIGSFSSLPREASAKQGLLKPHKVLQSPNAAN